MGPMPLSGWGLGWEVAGYKVKINHIAVCHSFYLIKWHQFSEKLASISGSTQLHGEVAPFEQKSKSNQLEHLSNMMH